MILKVVKRLMPVCLCLVLIFISACTSSEQASTSPKGTKATAEGTPQASISTSAPTAELTMDAIKQAARAAGYSVSSDGEEDLALTRQNSPFNNLVNEFTITINMKSKSGEFDSYENCRVFECATEADAKANAAMQPYGFSFDGKYVVNGKFFAEYFEYHDERDAAIKQLEECLSGVISGKPPKADDMLNLDIEAAATATAGVQAQAQGGKVTLIIPASLFTVTTEEQAVANAKAQGVEASKNADGTYTYVMTAEQQQKTLADFKKQLEDTLAQMQGSAYEDFIKNCEYNSDFSELKFTVNRKNYDSNDYAQAAVRIVCLLAPNYQAFSGNSNPITSVQLIDAATGQVYETKSSPADFIEN